MQTLVVQESRVLGEVLICYHDHHAPPPPAPCSPIISIPSEGLREGELSASTAAATHRHLSIDTHAVVSL